MNVLLNYVLSMGQSVDITRLQHINQPKRECFVPLVEYKVGQFYEIFDEVGMQTVFASEDKVLYQAELFKQDLF